MVVSPQSKQSDKQWSCPKSGGIKTTLSCNGFIADFCILNSLLSPSGDLAVKLVRDIPARPARPGRRHLGLSVPNCSKPFNDDLIPPHQTRPGNPGQFIHWHKDKDKEKDKDKDKDKEKYKYKYKYKNKTFIYPKEKYTVHTSIKHNIHAFITIVLLHDNWKHGGVLEGDPWKWICLN